MRLFQITEVLLRHPHETGHHVLPDQLGWLVDVASFGSLRLQLAVPEPEIHHLFNAFVRVLLRIFTIEGPAIEIDR